MGTRADYEPPVMRVADEPIELAINGRFLSQATTGVQRVARELTREIDHLVAARDMGFRLRLLCQRGADTSDLDLRATKIEEVGGPSGAMWEQVALPRAVGGAFLLCLGNTAPISLLLRRRRVALMIHDLSFRLFPRAYRPTYRAAHTLVMPLLRRADPIITVSETEKARLAGLMGAAAARVVVAQNGGWRQDDAAPPSDAAEAPRGYGLYVGSLSQRKNFGGVLATAIRLAREDGLAFRIVGSRGTILSPTDVAVPEDVADKITFVGQVEDLEVLADMYRGAHFLLFPSFYEASPLPPLEAMHFGCPVIASNIPPMRERCGDAAAYCEPEEIESIVAVARALLADPARTADLVARGYECAARYSWRTQAAKLLAAIRASHAARARR